MANKCLGIVICSWWSHDQKTELNSTSTFLSASNWTAWIRHNDSVILQPLTCSVKSQTLPMKSLEVLACTSGNSLTYNIFLAVKFPSWLVYIYAVCRIYRGRTPCSFRFRLPRLPATSLTIKMYLMHVANLRQQMWMSNTNRPRQECSLVLFFGRLM